MYLDLKRTMDLMEINMHNNFFKNILTFCTKYLLYKLSLRKICCYTLRQKNNHQKKTLIWKKAQLGTEGPILWLSQRTALCPRQCMQKPAIAKHRPSVPRRALLVGVGLICPPKSRFAPASRLKNSPTMKKKKKDLGCPIRGQP